MNNKILQDFLTITSTSDDKFLQLQENEYSVKKQTIDLFLNKLKNPDIKEIFTTLFNQVTKINSIQKLNNWLNIELKQTIFWNEKYYDDLVNNEENDVFYTLLLLLNLWELLKKEENQLHFKWILNWFIDSFLNFLVYFNNPSSTIFHTIFNKKSSENKLLLEKFLYKGFPDKINENYDFK